MKRRVIFLTSRARGHINEYVTEGEGIPYVLSVPFQCFIGVLKYQFMRQLLRFEFGDQSAARLALALFDPPPSFLLRRVCRHENELTTIDTAEERDFLGALELSNNIGLVREWRLFVTFVPAEHVTGQGGWPLSHSFAVSFLAAK